MLKPASSPKKSAAIKVVTIPRPRPGSTYLDDIIHAPVRSSGSAADKRLGDSTNRARNKQNYDVELNSPAAHLRARDREVVSDSFEKKIENILASLMEEGGADAVFKGAAQMAIARGVLVLSTLHDLLEATAVDAKSGIQIHPGVFMKQLIEDRNLTVIEAAETLGVTRQQLYNVFTGVSNVTAEMARKFEMSFGTPALDWIHMQAAFDLAELNARENEPGKPKRVRRASRLQQDLPAR